MASPVRAGGSRALNLLNPPFEEEAQAMGLFSVPASTAIYDRILRRIQKHFANRVEVPFEIRLWNDRAYRFGKGEPAVDILVRDRNGLAALGRLDELSICEAYMAGSLDVVGDMLQFVGLRGR
jgi:cyclopropane-fatty-acyl-phospholipid synthase